MPRILRGAPCLEVLNLWFIRTLTNAILDFNDGNDSDDDIISGFYHHDIFPEEMLRQIFHSIRRVEKLTLSSLCLKVIGDSRNKDKFVELSNAKILDFEVGAPHEILNVLEMCPNLMMLIVKHDKTQVFEYPSDYHRMQLLSCLDHLRTIEISWDLEDTSMVTVIEILLEKAIMLEKMVFRYKPYVDDPRSLLAEEKLLSLSRSSPNAELVLIKVDKFRY